MAGPPPFGIVLVSNGIGGCERRFANLFRHFLDQSVPGHFLINEELFSKLKGVGYDIDSWPRVHLLPERGAAATEPMPQAFLDRAGWGWRKSSQFLRTLLGRWRRVREVVRQHELKLVHGVLGGAAALVPFYASRKVATVMSIVDPTPLDGAGSASSAVQAFYRNLGLRLADGIDALSEPMRLEAIRLGAAPDRVHQAPGSFVDHRQFHVTRGERIVSFAARLTDWKNPLLFVEAAALVRARHPDVRFILAGEGEQEGEVRARVRALGLEERFELGFRPKPAEVVGRSSIFCSLQRFDNRSSQALLEAMVSANAIVATDVGDTRNLVDSQVGLLVPEEARAVAGAVCRLLEDDDLRRRLGSAARERILRSYTVDSFATYLLGVYERVLGR